MPPPSAADAWLAGRHFGIVIDAGSSGSRLQIYSWRDPRSITLEKNSELAYTLPKVEKGTQRGEEWVHKVEPGISSFADNPQDVGSYLRPLLSHAREHIPPSLEHDTPIFLLATAGMRLLPPIKQAEILQETCHFLTRHSNFKIDKASDIGPCGSSVRIITGEEEGLFGWIAVNYLMDGFSGAHQDRTTYGFLDMGGASTQIAFEPGEVSRKEEKGLMNVRLRQLGGQEINHKVFVTTWLGYGTNQARQRYVGKTITDYEASRSPNDKSDIVSDPCLPKDLRLYESPVHDEDTDSHSRREHTLKGTGSFEKCLAQTAPLLNKNVPCSQTPCLMDGIHVPPIDFSVSRFIGVSEYWYSSEHVFNLGGAYDFVEYERAASQFCSRDWDDIMRQHEQSKKKHQLGGDGEVERNGTIIEVGNWDAKVEQSRLEMQCFKAAWIANVLHEGLGLPRITDPGGNQTATEGAKVEKEATKKGLGPPAFQSLDTVGDISISWTLGKMVLEASKEVPIRGLSKPLVDPIEEVPNDPNFHVKPIRPAWSLKGMEDRLTPHLPVSLTRSSLGFSPVLFLLFIMICVLTFIFYPLRRHVRATFLRSMRRIGIGRAREEYSLEEGTFYGRRPGSAPSTPTSASKAWFYPVQRIISASMAQRPPSPISTTPSSINGRFTNANGPGRASPTRSNSLPAFDTQRINEAIGSSSQLAYTISRSPSPAPAFMTDDPAMKPPIISNGQLSSRSRNASTTNLARTVLSRTPSYQKGL